MQSASSKAKLKREESPATSTRSINPKTQEKQGGDGRLNIQSFSPNPRKAAVERAWLEYSLVWCSALGLVMLLGLGSYWEDKGLMALGAAAMLGAYIWPVLRVKDLHFPTLHGMFYGNVALSFGMNYIQAPFFFDVLHMRYGFKVTARIDRNPIFLYFLTVAYFTTYSVLASMAWRFASTTPMRRSLRMPLLAAVPFLVAFGETVVNANPLIADLFCYDDMFLALTFGTFAYGLGFVFSLPVWLHATPDVAQVPSNRPGLFNLFLSWNSRLWHNVFGQLIGTLLHGCCLWFLRHFVAAMLTDVVLHSSPFGGCLPDGYREPLIAIG